MMTSALRLATREHETQTEEGVMGSRGENSRGAGLQLDQIRLQHGRENVGGRSSRLSPSALQAAGPTSDNHNLK
jgi:hypothetical protein